MKIFKGKEKIKLDELYTLLHSFWLQKYSVHMYTVWLFHMAPTAGAVYPRAFCVIRLVSEQLSLRALGGYKIQETRQETGEKEAGPFKN